MAKRMRTTNQYGCTQSVQPTKLERLYADLARLEKLMVSGIQELDQPELGRAQYRSMAEMERARQILLGQIAEETPAVDPNAWMRVRRPIIVGPKGC